MGSVTFPPELGGDGSTVTDDANPTTGLAQGGHRTRFVPALAQVVAVAGFVVGRVAAAAESAAEALGYKNQAAAFASDAAVEAGKSQVEADRALAERNSAETYAANASGSASAAAGSVTAANQALIALNGAITNGLGVFSVNAQGELIVDYDDGVITNLHINANGELIISYS